jgi:hypothetical protein
MTERQRDRANHGQRMHLLGDEVDALRRPLPLQRRRGRLCRQPAFFQPLATPSIRVGGLHLLARM